MASLINELEKIYLIHGTSSSILRNDSAANHLTGSCQYSIFDLLNYVLDGNLKKSITILHTLLKTGSPSLLLLHMLLKETRRLLTLSESVYTSRLSISQILTTANMWPAQKNRFHKALNRKGHSIEQGIQSPPCEINLVRRSNC